jgi:hypothetical protein
MDSQASPMSRQTARLQDKALSRSLLPLWKRDISMLRFQVSSYYPLSIIGTFLHFLKMLLFLI